MFSGTAVCRVSIHDSTKLPLNFSQLPGQYPTSISVWLTQKHSQLTIKRSHAGSNCPLEYALLHWQFTNIFFSYRRRFGPTKLKKQIIDHWKYIYEQYSNYAIKHIFNKWSNKHISYIYIRFKSTTRLYNFRTFRSDYREQFFTKYNI